MTAAAMTAMSSRDIAYIALFAAVTAALALFPPLMLPVTGVPITAQSMGPMLAGLILGAKRGALSQALLVMLVIVGLPLLSGGRGGLGVMIGPSGGFIFGWIVAAFVTGWLTERFWDRLTVFRAGLFAFVGGILVVYLCGIPWMATIGGIPIADAMLGSAWYLPGDMIKVAIAAMIAITVKRSYPLIEPRR
jgi:biotin transport system substrate-specific component